MSVHPSPRGGFLPRRSTVGDPTGARSGDARTTRVDPGGASVRPWRPAARTPAQTVEARRRRARHHANPDRAPAYTTLCPPPTPYHVAEIPDVGPEDRHVEDDLPERVRR